MTTNTSSSLDLSSVVPPPPAHFYGRDHEVKGAVDKLMSTTQHHIAIVGGGGIGKTSVALSIINDETVKTRNLCCFIPCDAFSTASDLVLGILQVIKGNVSSRGDPKENLISRLEVEVKRPVILVLDNFESPWDSPGARTELIDVLKTLASLPRLQLVMTIRSDYPPARGDILWTSLFLEPLSMAAARELFLAVNPKTLPTEYLDLDLLLNKLDGLPLAVKLLAELKYSMTCAGLLRRWKEQATSLLDTKGQSPSRLTSFDISVSLSLESQAMRDVPEALELLAVICHLPDGVKGGSDQLVEMQLGLTDVDTALATISTAALAYNDPSGGIRVLSPIRQYITTKHPPSTLAFVALYKYYIGLVDGHDYQERGNADFFESLAVLERESGNIVSLFKRQIVSVDRLLPDVWHATLLFSKFSRDFRPSTELMDELLSRWTELNVPAPRADGLEKRGYLLYRLNSYLSARNDYEAALECYTSVGDNRNVALCLTRLGHCHCELGELDLAIQKYSDARDMFLATGDAWGQAEVLQSLGVVHQFRHECKEAMEKLIEARDKYREIGYRQGTARCLLRLSALHRLLGNDEQAMNNLSQSRAIVSQMGYRNWEADCLWEWAVIHQSRGEYDQAVEKLTSARDIFTKLGDRHSVAHCLFRLATIHIELQEHDQAVQKLIEALGMYPDPLCQAQCKRRLGQVHRLQHEYAHAADELGQALSLALSLGNSYEIARCRFEMGLVHRELRDYTQALEHISVAQDLMEEIELRSHVAYCSELILDIRAERAMVRRNILDERMLLTGLHHAQNESKWSSTRLTTKLTKHMRRMWKR
jgi:tetratricopeptide (TPR) repeat protein